MSLQSRQQTNAEWDLARPMIEHLYIRECRPLSTVRQTMQACYHFTASTAMYKRKLRAWGTYKNTKYRTQPLGGGASRNVVTPRYLRQNVADESLHTLLDLLAPWITHADSLWSSAKRMHCPPRAAFVYDEFTQTIVAAVGAFESGDVASGGLNLRRAFVDLERTLTPTSRSVFTLHSLLFALAILNHAGLSKASKLLITHAMRLVALHTQAQPDPTQAANSSLGLILDPVVPGQLHQRGHLSHPFAQILQRLQVLAIELEDSKENATQAVLRAWSAYHRLSGQASARSVASQVSQREFWKSAIRTRRSSSKVPAQAASWEQKIAPVLHYLYRLLDCAKATMVDDFRLACLDEIVSIYSFSKSDRFEETALELLSIARKKSCPSAGTETALLEQWGCNASLELANFYLAKNDMDNVFKSFYNTVPESLGTEWEAIFLGEFQCWAQEQGRAEESQNGLLVT